MGAANGWPQSAGLSECVPLEVMVARVFNPIGPGTPVSQALGRFASRLAEPGPDPLELAVGDLDSRRDFIDVRDVARAMVELAQRGRPGLVYHVGTGQSHRVGDGLDRLVQLSGRSSSAQRRLGIVRPPRARPTLAPISSGSRRTQAGGRRSHGRRACSTSGIARRVTPPRGTWARTSRLEHRPGSAR